jgi:transcriptional regulator with XRE-family HTH domain
MLNKALRLMRVFHDLSQKELAEKIGISKSFISEIESGKKNLTIDLLQRYADFFDIPMSSIIFFSENLDKDSSTDKLRFFVSSKILTMLDLVAKNSDRSYAKE